MSGFRCAKSKEYPWGIVVLGASVGNKIARHALMPCRGRYGVEPDCRRAGKAGAEGHGAGRAAELSQNGHVREVLYQNELRELMNNRGDKI
jgi:hypothetical protein